MLVWSISFVWVFVLFGFFFISFVGDFVLVVLLFPPPPWNLQSNFIILTAS